MRPSSARRPVAPIGAAQPASRRPSRARSARTARCVGRWSSARRAARERRVGLESGADLDGERALAGCGRHDVGAERLGDRVEPPEPGQSRAGEHDGVEVAGSGGGAGDAAEAGVDVAADVDDVEVGAGGEELGRAAGRAGADAGAGGQQRRASARPGRTGRRRGPRAAGPPRATSPSASPVGRSLRECTATSQRPSRSASRRAVTKTPVPPRLCSEPVRRSPSVRTWTVSRVRSPRPRTARASTTWPVCVSASALARVPTRTCWSMRPVSLSVAGMSKRGEIPEPRDGVVTVCQKIPPKKCDPRHSSTACRRVVRK